MSPISPAVRHAPTRGPETLEQWQQKHSDHGEYQVYEANMPHGTIIKYSCVCGRSYHMKKD